MKFGAIFIGIGLLAAGWLHFGVYQDREWGGLHFFRKFRPTSKFFFSSPLGERDWPASGPTPEQAKQEADYVEFVERRASNMKPTLYRPNP